MAHSELSKVCASPVSIPTWKALSYSFPQTPPPRSLDPTTRLRHKLVNVVVVAILDAGVDTASPRGPQAIADPALAKRCHTRGRPVGGMASVESVSEL